MAGKCRFGVLAGILLLSAFLASAEAEVFVLEHGTLTFAEDGRLTGYATDRGAIALHDIALDAGIDGEYLLGSLGFQRYYDLNTWELARVIPKAKWKDTAKLISLKRQGKAIEVRTRINDVELVRSFEPSEHGLKVEASIHSERPQVSEVQGIALSVRGVRAGENTAFRFPGNSPYGAFTASHLHPFKAKCADYCAPVVRVERPIGCAGMNLVFLHEEEKWSTALWVDREQNLSSVHLVMAEGLLRPDESYAVGPLYLQLTGQGNEGGKAVQMLYQGLGYSSPVLQANGIGPVYSLHPAGPMDAGMDKPQTMWDFSSVLPGLQEMGIKNLWLLPMFEHSGRGVYEPSDQARLDPRYGSDEDFRHFVKEAHRLGMRVLLDYVPHGPYPQDALAQEHPDWCSIHRSGKPQTEWNCVSFDMTNAAYLDYTKQLSADHALRFGTDGGRIDCAMGGLSNWQAGNGKRASSSGLRGGLSIVQAIRAGYESQGKWPLLLPENFHPLPAYAKISNLFYDMPLYRVMYDMREKGLDEKDFAVSLAQWLDDEYSYGVPGQQRLRFLGNHDTVSWTWDKARAVKVYGEEKAKALWTLFAVTDGVPFVYQGDEYSPLYDKRTLVDLRAFFQELFSVRAAYLRPGMETSYVHRDSPVMALTRKDKEGAVLALINLSPERQDYPLPPEARQALWGSGAVQNNTAKLEPYGSLLIRLQ